MGILRCSWPYAVCVDDPVTIKDGMRLFGASLCTSAFHEHKTNTDLQKGFTSYSNEITATYKIIEAECILPQLSSAHTQSGTSLSQISLQRHQREDLHQHNFAGSVDVVIKHGTKHHPIALLHKMSSLQLCRLTSPKMKAPL